MTTVPMVGQTVCANTLDLHPNDDTGLPLQAVCTLPAGHSGAHWARVEGWGGEPYSWATVDVPAPRRPSETRELNRG